MHWFLLIIRWLFIGIISFGLSALIGLFIISEFGVSTKAESVLFFLLGLILIYPVHKYLVDF